MRQVRSDIKIDPQQLELLIMYQLCGVELRSDGLFYEKRSTMPITGTKVAYGRKMFGLVKTKMKRAEISFRNGLHDGPMKLWHSNGNKWLEMEYRHGKPHGWRRRWFENGEIEEESLFENGQPVESHYFPNVHMLQKLLELYELRLREGGIEPRADISSKEFIDLFLTTEEASIRNSMRNASGNLSKFYRELIGMIESSRREIVNFIYENMHK